MLITCASAAYTDRPGGCGSVATTLLVITFAERRTQRWAMCNQHAAGVHEDLADPLLAYLRHTSVTQTPIRPAADPDRQGET
ncbi:hypothetical protein ACGF12_30310 [Kitasatospora sp. NPDC048296]|uniref:hypothetical protein n=1 Tax=Kitasatospora sp. NPDC048296 TaxID=3364048 RepID=UPI00371C77A1